MKYSDFAADIKAKLEAVPGTGIIHTYERQAADLAKFIALFKDAAGKICGCEITRRAVSEHQRGAFFRHHQMVVKAYRGLQDMTGSSMAFQDMLDDICAAFRTADPAASGATWYYKNGDNDTAAPAQIESINDRMFGSVLCHCAEISISVTERIIA